MPLLQPPAPDLRASDLTYTDAYNSIVSRVRRSGGSGSGGVVILCGVDAVSESRQLSESRLIRQDGLLAARILASLFRQDDIPYRLIPICGYAELELKRDEVLTSDELHTIILLSLGSLLPLASYFTLPPSCHLHIIDSHRPWNLENLFGVEIDGNGDDEGKFWVWGDGEENELGSVRQSWEALEVCIQASYGIPS